MKTSLSLAEELRAIRGGISSKVGPRRSTQPPEAGPSQAGGERPWQADIERVQQTLREVLQAISRLSGVELPQGAPESQSLSDSLSRLDCNTLKDRIRNDLEAFSVTTVSEMSRQAEEQARSTINAIRREVSSQIEQVAGEYREKLQERVGPQQIEIDVSKQSQERVSELVRAQTDEFARWVWMTCRGTGTPIPVQIEKMLGPYVEEATDRFTEGIRQCVQGLLVEQEQLVHERFHGTLSSLEGQIHTLEQAAQQICESKADSVTKLSEERLNTAADEAAKNFEGRVQEHIEGSLAGIQARLDETAALLRERLQAEADQKAQGFIHRMEALASEVSDTRVSEISARIEQTTAAVTESSLQQLRQQAQDSGEHSREQLRAFLQQEVEGIRGKIQEAARSVHESVEQDAARVTERLREMDQQLDGIQQKYLADSQQQLSSMVQDAVGSLEPRIRELADRKMEEAGAALRKSQDETVAQFEQRLREVSEGRYHELLERIQKEAGEAGSQALADVRNASQSALEELSAKVDTSASILREHQAQSSVLFESSVNDTLENYRRELAQITEEGVQQHRHSISESVTDLQNRLKHVAELLVEGIPTSA